MRAWLPILIIFSFLFSQIVIADDTITVEIYSDANITGWINATANGSVVFYIQGIDILNEIDSLWSAVKSAKSKASSAYSKASKAYVIAKSNSGKISLMEADIQNNTAKIYILRDELISFENDYIKFKNCTLNNITLLQLELNDQKEAISDLREDLKNYKQLMNYALLTIIILICVLYIIIVYIVWRWKGGNIRKRVKDIEVYVEDKETSNEQGTGN